MQKQNTNIQPPKPTIHKYTNIQCNKPKTHNLNKEMKQTKQPKKRGANQGKRQLEAWQFQAPTFTQRARA